jgi:hypothetical protein
MGDLQRILAASAPDRNLELGSLGGADACSRGDVRTRIADRTRRLRKRTGGVLDIDDRSNAIRLLPVSPKPSGRPR